MYTVSSSIQCSSVAILSRQCCLHTAASKCVHASLLLHVHSDYVLQMNLVELLQGLPVHLMACLATQQPQPTAAGMATTDMLSQTSICMLIGNERSGTAFASCLWALQVGLR